MRLTIDSKPVAGTFSFGNWGVCMLTLSASSAHRFPLSPDPSALLAGERKHCSMANLAHSRSLEGAPRRQPTCIPVAPQ
jgi:hypothetical protein